MYEWKSVNRAQKHEWSVLSINTARPEDIKFSPTVELGFTLGIVSTEGNLELRQYSSQNIKKTLSEVAEPCTEKISKYGLNCLSWSKGSSKRSAVIAVGGKSHETTPMRVFEGHRSLA